MMHGQTNIKFSLLIQLHVVTLFKSFTKTPFWKIKNYFLQVVKNKAFLHVQVQTSPLQQSHEKNTSVWAASECKS